MTSPGFPFAATAFTRFIRMVVKSPNSRPNTFSITSMKHMSQSRPLKYIFFALTKLLARIMGIISESVRMISTNPLTKFGTIQQLCAPLRVNSRWTSTRCLTQRLLPGIASMSAAASSATFSGTSPPLTVKKKVLRDSFTYRLIPPSVYLVCF